MLLMMSWLPLSIKYPGNPWTRDSLRTNLSIYFKNLSLWTAKETMLILKSTVDSCLMDERKLGFVRFWSFFEIFSFIGFWKYFGNYICTYSNTIVFWMSRFFWLCLYQWPIWYGPYEEIALSGLSVASVKSGLIYVL